AALFRWAMFAGATAGGLGPDHVDALEQFGAELGIAFQAIDDALDLAGDPELTKKSLAVDLREGKVTYPILIGLERDGKGELRRALEEIIRDHGEDDDALPEHLRMRVLGALERTGALDATVALARERVTRARAHLETLPPSSTKALLEIIAEAMVQRTF
ncbi:polyprenyl synthetase family protein, partial [Myxococcota bacterium]|nr:polyprenyl synthetase family protein [Myxococcota bacterium]